jgi:hypothetical protein
VAYIGRWGGWLVVSLAACAPEPEPTEPVEVAVWPEEWDYRSFCWYYVQAGCKTDAGEPLGDERVNCIGKDDEYACVVDALEDLGEDGWHLEIGEAFPEYHTVYLLVRGR